MQLPINEITIPEGRRALRGLDTLIESIGEVGLIYPINVSEDHELIAGYHRLEACKKLGWEEIPVNVMSVGDIDRELIEIDENYVRNEYTDLERGENLAWRKALYEARYPETRHGCAPCRNDTDIGKEENGSTLPNREIGKEENGSTLPKGEKAEAPTTLSFAEAEAKKRKVTPRTIRSDVFFGTNILPEVRDQIRNTPVATAKTELLQVAKMDEETQRRIGDKIAAGATSIKQVLLEEQIEKAAEENRKLPTKARIQKKDAREFLSGINTGTINLLITDPPHKPTIANIDKFAQSWVPLAMSRVKSSGRAFIFTGAHPKELQAYLNTILGAQTHLNLAQVLVWTYPNPIGIRPTHGYKLNWQAIFYLHGPDVPPLNNKTMAEQMSVQQFDAPKHTLGKRYFASKKPDELAERLIRHSTKENDLVVDPFAGTGTFLLAAAKLGRQAIGCEMDDQMLGLALGRGCVNEK